MYPKAIYDVVCLLYAHTLYFIVREEKDGAPREVSSRRKKARTVTNKTSI